MVGYCSRAPFAVLLFAISVLVYVPAYVSAGKESQILAHPFTMRCRGCQWIVLFAQLVFLSPLLRVSTPFVVGHSSERVLFPSKSFGPDYICW